MPFSRGSSQPRDQTWVSCMLAHSKSSEPLGKPIYSILTFVFFNIIFFFFFFCPVVQSVGSQLPDQGWNQRSY